jgi:hypothetical protein
MNYIAIFNHNKNVNYHVSMLLMYNMGFNFCVKNLNLFRIWFHQKQKNLSPDPESKNLDQQQ